MMKLGASGCPMRGGKAGGQHLADGLSVRNPVTIPPVLGKINISGIVEPAAGPAESRL